MNSLWWLALPTLLLPIWWHRKKRVQVAAEPLASARFLPRTEPRQMRVWRWADVILMIVRCLLLACLIAWLADPVLPWRGNTVVVAEGTDAAWVEQQAAQAGLEDAARLPLPAAEALSWVRAHEREWKPNARLLVLGDIPMPATLPQFRHALELRTLAKPAAPREVHVAIVSERAGEWRRMFAALDGPLRAVVDAVPGAKTELIVWDKPEAPPPSMRAPLWWAANTAAFPELAKAPGVDGIRYAGSARGRLWTSGAWPPGDAAAARRLLETWRSLHYAPLPHAAPAHRFAASNVPATQHADGALRDFLMMALVALFALERTLTHARRR
ncbi:BatA domain-containing protein [Massilia sp. IC2-278]|uniref:BatA domain-containing protein n=1 Tax=Massilia sp. IC2-278 TaxID=2887200 RepID=UPI001E44CA5D|nr:BatA domain-containing protein [Massilia sp. IC2-278]MCC2963130.1 BatA domain-containing protein [Massilia sp. IC2-278]